MSGELEPQPGRVPPSDLDAEAAVLSACMLDVDKVDIVRDILVPEDFYADANRRILEAIYGLQDAQKTIDIVQIAGWLRDNNRLDQIGGAPYLAQIVDATPSIAHVAEHATRVKEKAKQRVMISVCQRAAAEGYGDVGVVSEWLEGVEKNVALAAREARDKEITWATYGEAARQTYKDIAESARTGATMAGYPTGFEELDNHVGGLADGDFWIVGGYPGIGKAQPLDALVLTPTGWRTIGDLAAGDPIIGADGKPYQVTGVFDQGERDVFRVKLSDGGSAECCDEHLWLTRTRADRQNGRPGSVKQLAEIRQKLKRDASGGLNHSIPFAGPVEFTADVELEIDPWLLGIYLGDGYTGCNVMFSNPENDIRARLAVGLPECVLVPIDSKDMRVRGPDFLHRLKRIGLKGKRSWEKFIPRPYLLASVAAREALLQGLCDADGFVTGFGSIEYLTVSPQLRDDIVFLVGSLGGRVTWQAKATHYTKNGDRHDCREAYRMVLSFPQGNLVPVSSVKHLGKYKAPLGRLTERFIASVEPSRRTTCRCIAVSAPDHLYVTNDFIVTHNTSFVKQTAENVARQKTKKGARVGVAFFTLEMKYKQLTMRALSRLSEVPFANIRIGRMVPNQWESLVKEAQAASNVAMILDECRDLTPFRMRRALRRHLAKLREDHGEDTELGLVCVDYIQLMGADVPNKNRAVEIGMISKELKRIAGEFKCAVIGLSSLNRPEQKTRPKPPGMSALRESGALEFDADVILMIHRDDAFKEKHEQPDHLADLNVVKGRNSGASHHELQFDGRFTAFYPLGRELFPRVEANVYGNDWRDPA